MFVRFKIYCLEGGDTLKILQYSLIPIFQLGFWTIHRGTLVLLGQRALQVAKVEGLKKSAISASLRAARV